MLEVRVIVHVCVSVRERERERERVWVWVLELICFIVMTLVSRLQKNDSKRKEVHQKRNSRIDFFVGWEVLWDH